MTKSKTIKLRLTEGEHRRLKALAGKRGVSGLLRMCALGPDRTQRKSERLGLIAELARIRNLLVHIAQNSVRRPPVDQVMIVSQLVTMERELTRLNPA
jgi:mobilization protein NikA